MYEPDILRLRVLLALYQAAETKPQSVTLLAKTLDEEKYTISRAMRALEREGLVDRSEARHPRLTPDGREEAKHLAARVEVAFNYLAYQGMDTAQARVDAYHWALNNSDAAMEAIRETGERYRVKLALRGEESFQGDALCRLLRDGVYRFPFIVYRMNYKGDSNLSMANKGFRHPCKLVVKDGEGTVYLHPLVMRMFSAVIKKSIEGSVRNLRYFDGEQYVPVQKEGTELTFPAAALSFHSMGDGSQMLHGSVRMKMEASVGRVCMPESEAVFALLI